MEQSKHAPGSLTPKAVELVGRHLAARAFNRRKRRGAGASEIRLSQEELAALLGAAFEGGYAARDRCVTHPRQSRTADNP